MCFWSHSEDAVLVQVELQDPRHTHDKQGLVSLIVKDSRPR